MCILKCFDCVLPRLCVAKNACELRLVQIGFVALGVVLPWVHVLLLEQVNLDKWKIILVLLP